jgi:hypothetical protein
MITGPVVATYDHMARVFQLYDRARCRALFHVHRGDRLPDWHDRAPFRQLLSLWTDDNQLALLHGSAVATDGGAVVLAGVSGSGKSTTALTCHLAGMQFLADDASLVDPKTGTVHSVYGRAKLEPEVRDRIPELGVAIPTVPNEQGGLVVSPEQPATSARLRAILLIEVDDRTESVLCPTLSSSEALPAVLETLRVENRGITPDCFRTVQAVLAEIPVRRLRVGSDRTAIVEAVLAAMV